MPMLRLFSLSSSQFLFSVSLLHLEDDFACVDVALHQLVGLLDVCQGKNCVNDGFERSVFKQRQGQAREVLHKFLFVLKNMVRMVQSVELSCSSCRNPHLLLSSTPTPPPTPSPLPPPPPCKTINNKYTFGKQLHTGKNKQKN